MLDDTPPGASLEAPETFQILQAPVWPRLPVALGYTGGARWVAFLQRGNQTRWHDGESSAAVSDAGLFLAYRRHPKISVHLAGAHLGSDDEETSIWLVLDTLQHLCYLASPDAARLFLARQWPRDTRTPALEYAPDELGRLHDLPGRAHFAGQSAGAVG
jgi:hypothetical protein